MTTYTVIDTTGDIIKRHLSVEDAAHEILTHDGHGYEFRQCVDEGWRLWVTPFSRNSPVGGKPLTPLFWSSHDDLEKARAELFQRVIAETWRRYPEAVTDDAYDAMIAELAMQEAEA